MIELKAGRADDRVFGQVMSYMGWVTEHLPHGRKVAGLVISDGEDGRISGSAIISQTTSHPVRRIDLKDLGLHGRTRSWKEMADRRNCNEPTQVPPEVSEIHCTGLPAHVLAVGE